MISPCAASHVVNAMPCPARTSGRPADPVVGDRSVDAGHAVTGGSQPSGGRPAT